MGGKSAAANMSPGHVVLFSVASVVIGTIIVFNVGGSVASPATAGVPTAGLLIAIFLGAGAVVGGVIIALLARSRLKSRAPLFIAFGSCVVAGGVIAIAIGVTVLLSANVDLG